MSSFAQPVVHVVGSTANPTNPQLVQAWRALGVPARLVTAAEAERYARPGDVVLGRLDVLPSFEGIEPGLLTLLLLERRGLRVLNRAATLLAVHDKLRTARALAAAGIPQPRTAVLKPGRGDPEPQPPVVLKPRFGSWGRDVVLCPDAAAVESALAEFAGRGWYRRHGVLVQELLPPRGRDLRLVVAGGMVVAASERIAAPGEWRTNVSLGGKLRAPLQLPARARELAVAAARAVRGDLVGVDLLPVAGGWNVLELNGAVDFDQRYALPGRDAYADSAHALALAPRAADAAVA
jgi:RimK family alpha-L-glutamate ligase